MTNYLGTYTFASLADYQAGRPSGYTRRIGDPRVRYSTPQAAAYLQDDWRVARSLLLSAGIRYGLEQHVGDRWNVSPRVTVAWSPFRNGRRDAACELRLLLRLDARRALQGERCSWTASGSGNSISSTRPTHSRPRDLDSVDAALRPSNRYLWPGDLALPGGHRI